MIGVVDIPEQRSAARASDEAPPARARVLQAMQDWIRNGVLEPGSRLPPERDLSARLGADRATVRRAVDILIDQGLVQSHSPRTRTVMPRAQPSPLMARTVAILTPYTSEEPLHRQEGWIEFIDRGVAAELRASDRHALFLHPGILAENLGDLIQGRPIGVLVTELGGEWPAARQAAQALREAGVPVVAFGEAEEWSGLDCVASDHAAGATALTEWLLARGCRSVLQSLPPRKGAWTQLRRMGHERALRAADVEPLPLLDMPDLPYSANDEAFHVRARTVAGYLAPVFQRSAVDALMVASDGDLAAAAAACRLLGREPGSDLLLVGYDNYWRDCPEQRFDAAPPAATVDKCNAEIGRELVRLLAARRSHELPDAPQQRLVAPQLVATSDAAVASARRSPIAADAYRLPSTPIESR